MIPYLVCEFSKPTLSNLVKECFGQYFPDILEKRQIGYAYKYLNDLGAKSILLEFKYLDKDYLEDYSQYYVRSFGNNGHKCARLHFFAEEVDHGRLDQILAKGNEKEITKLQNAYLGFVVIKPLPKTFVGKTCLKNYSSINTVGGMKRCLSKKYKVDLFGISLSVNSIAFQEQDQVVSACATTAIWTALHALPKRDVRSVPACSIITTHAINHITGSSNSFPNRGLTNVQILRSLDYEGLRHHEFNIQTDTKENFLEVVRSHIDSGFPLILGVDVYDPAKKPGQKNKGGHAITILGYDLTNDASSIYVHDDRMGPFAKAAIVELGNKDCGDEFHGRWGLELQEKDDSGKCNAFQEYLLPTSLIIPTPQKARLGFSYPKKTCDLIVEVFEQTIIKYLPEGTQISGALKFDIKLMEISEIRQTLIKSVNAANGAEWEEEKKKFLTGSYARFQWVASFTLYEVPAFKMLIDATDIPQGDAISFIFTEEKQAADVVLTVFKEYGKQSDKISGQQNTNFFSSFVKYLGKSRSSRSAYLDLTYGELRAPKYLKGDEIVGDPEKGNDTVIRIYDSSDQSLGDIYDKLKNGDECSNVIWAISHDGILLMGREVGEKGHPTLTGFKAARIAGELKKAGDKWVINSKSGRYSGDYLNKKVLLENAKHKMISIFFCGAGDGQIVCSDGEK